MKLSSVLKNKGRFYTTLSVDEGSAKAVFLITNSGEALIVAHSQTKYVGCCVMNPELWEVRELVDARVVGAILAKSAVELKATLPRK
jgi:hypothetical protein